MLFHLKYLQMCPLNTFVNSELSRGLKGPQQSVENLRENLFLGQSKFNVKLLWSNIYCGKALFTNGKTYVKAKLENICKSKDIDLTISSIPTNSSTLVSISSRLFSKHRTCTANT